MLVWEIDVHVVIAIAFLGPILVDKGPTGEWVAARPRSTALVAVVASRQLGLEFLHGMTAQGYVGR
jgi:hypothetical protein